MLCSCTSHPATAAGDHCSLVLFYFVLCCLVLCNWWPMFWSENTSTEGTSSHRLIRCSGRWKQKYDKGAVYFLNSLICLFVIFCCTVLTTCFILKAICRSNLTFWGSLPQEMLFRLKKQVNALPTQLCGNYESSRELRAVKPKQFVGKNLITFLPNHSKPFLRILLSAAKKW